MFPVPKVVQQDSVPCSSHTRDKGEHLGSPLPGEGGAQVFDLSSRRTSRRSLRVDWAEMVSTDADKRCPRSSPHCYCY